MNPFNNIKFVMVNTSHPGNIGAAARSIKTMGLHRLCLVEPKDFPSDTAFWRAAGGKDILENAEIVSSLDEALASCTLVYAASARKRYIPWPLQDIRTAAQSMAEHAHRPDGTVAIVFGREDAGLSNEELQKCHAHLTIPADDDYGVLNIAAAVQVVSYELRMAITNTQPMQSEWDVPPASIEALEHLYTHVMEVMGQVGFYDKVNPKQMPTRIKRLIMREQLDQMEVNMLRGFLSNSQARFDADKIEK